jgi:hypothetical protein
VSDLAYAAQAFQDIENSDAEPFDLALLTPEQAAGKTPKWADLIALWQARRQGELAPDWSQFDFADFRGLHASMVVSEFQTDEPDPTMFLIGEEFRRLYDSNPRGLSFSQTTPRLYAIQFRDHFQAIRDHGWIGHVQGQVAMKGKEHFSVEVLELPLRYGAAAIQRMFHLVEVTL